MWKQIIICRKDLSMSPGKLAAQVSHASMAFLTTMIRNSISQGTPEYSLTYEPTFYEVKLMLNKDLHEQWINGAYTKCVLEARNKNHLLKAKRMAEEFGMKEGEDFFLVYDNCYTELTPEEENGTTLTAIGFRPMPAEIIDKIGKKHHLYI